MTTISRARDPDSRTDVGLRRPGVSVDAVSLRRWDAVYALLPAGSRPSRSDWDLPLWA